MNNKEFSIIVGGAAGQGSRKAGLIIAKLFNELGYNIFIHEDYQSLIKGGHNFSKIMVSDKEVLCERDKVEFLLALDKNTIVQHESRLTSDGKIVFNKDKIDFDKGIGVAAETITKEAGGIPIMSNTALIGALAKIIGVDFSVLSNVLEKEIKKELEKNKDVAKRAYDSVESLMKVEATGKNPKPLLTGNEAIALGAVSAGLEKYIAYPMTPATSVLHYLADHKEELNVATIQMEDEISVVNMAIGSAYAGKRTMVGTSGGGFALMTEAISLSAMSETPLVIINSQRTGPATGVPTYSGQSDLLFTLASGHGDFTRFIIAPSDVNEAFIWSNKIMNLAWKYQTPAILLVDKELSENTFPFDETLINSVKKEEGLMFDGNGEYSRYKNAENGISPMAFPGEIRDTVKSTSYEHDEKGITVEDALSIILMQEKRLRKFKEMEKEVDNLKAVKTYGKGSKVIICWGSNKGVSREVGEKLGMKVVQPIILQPFPTKQMQKALEGAEEIILVESNATAQMEHVLNSYGIKVDRKILKYDGRPFTLEELESKIKE
ncbi:MAG: 2-oxoacid:acceptor oxidoreductase subunit alpha [Candidatus Pacebacteria bacterium]|nr:2-oxoacid:acceptor oxidoreductase subunit alpha [Candidatus Paceibacterota bacterium]